MGQTVLWGNSILLGVVLVQGIQEPLLIKIYPINSFAEALYFHSSYTVPYSHLKILAVVIQQRIREAPKCRVGSYILIQIFRKSQPKISSEQRQMFMS